MPHDSLRVVAFVVLFSIAVAVVGYVIKACFDDPSW